ncbi:MATE family efflux transporter [Acetobacter papayae]|uniref:MATE family efflux transporter n=2 Tax=Acetobacter papayae TaxID=1076592 RepID=UPI000471012D
MPTPGSRNRACFITGSIMRHVLVMSGTGAIGLMAVFAVDMLNMIYISHLGSTAMTAAIGFASAVIGLQIAVAIGLTIGISAVTAREIGAGNHHEAQAIASSALTVTLIVTAILGLGTLVWARPILALFGARGDALDAATTYLRAVSTAMPLICMGMASSSLMRVVGDAKGSMNITLIGAVVAAVLDPLFIFGFHEGLTGAAISTLLSRLVVSIAGLRGAMRHDMLALPSLKRLLPDSRRVANVALPAILTNLATPAGGVYVTSAMAGFGLEAVAGQASIERMVPVLFALVFALTGSIGPIMGQNLGAGRYDRVNQTLTAALKIVVMSVSLTWGFLICAQGLVVDIYSAHDEAAALIHLFCTWTIGSYLFVGMLFVANSAFNNLGFPLYSTAFNWGRATLGTVPFVMAGERYGPLGVQAGQAIGAVLFGTLAILTAFHVTRNLKTSSATSTNIMARTPESVPVSDIPTTSAEAAMAELDDVESVGIVYTQDRMSRDVEADSRRTQRPPR